MRKPEPIWPRPPISKTLIKEGSFSEDETKDEIHDEGLKNRIETFVRKNMEGQGDAYINKIFKMCSKIPCDIRFFAHHRIKPFISDVPKNVKILEPCIYSDMVDAMAKCKFIITDSGSIQKTSPFFGKNTLVMRERGEWRDTERCGIVRLEGSEEEDIAWIMSKSASREKSLYLNKKALPAEIIVNTIVDSMREA